MNLMAYDAMAIGSLELSLGPDLLRERMAEAEFPFLSANVFLSGTNQLVGQPYVVLDVVGHRVGVMGLTEQPKGGATGFRVLDPLEALRSVVPELSAQAETVVVLTSAGYSSGLAWAAAVPGIDLLIAGAPAQLPADVVAAPGTGTWVVSAEQPVPRHSGRRVGRLAAMLTEDGALEHPRWESVAMTADLLDDVQMRALLDGFRQ